MGVSVEILCPGSNCIGIAYDSETLIYVRVGLETPSPETCTGHTADGQNPA